MVTLSAIQDYKRWSINCSFYFERFIVWGGQKMKVVDLVLISTNQFWDSKNQQRINSDDWYSVQI